MKHKKFIAAVFALLCVLSLAGCGGNHTGQDDRETPADSQNESRTDNGDAGTSGGSSENPTDLDELLDTALLRGSVADFQNGSFQVVPDQDDGQTVIAAAPGMEDSSESTTVSYDGDCIFQIANINSSTGAVELEAAASSDVKKSTSVYVYGETQDNGEIHASKVLIPRYQ